MIWFLLLIPAVLLALGIWKWRTWEVAALFMVVFGAVILLVILIALPASTIGNGAKLAELQAFVKANNLNYAITVDRTASYLSEERFVEEALIPIVGSVERMELAVYISDKITEWRDGVNDYNTTVASMKYYDSNPFLGILYPDGVQDMPLLIITK